VHEEQRERLAAALDAAIKLRFGLGECARLEAGATQVEVRDSRVEEAVRVGDRLRRLARVAGLQREVPVDDPAGVRTTLA